MGLKFFRLLHADEVIDSLRRFMNKLADIFYLYRYMFDNLVSWIKAAITFLLFVHYFACGWIYIYQEKIDAGK